MLEQAFRIELDNDINNFLEILCSSQEITNHHRNIQILTTELVETALFALFTLHSI